MAERRRLNRPWQLPLAALLMIGALGAPPVRATQVPDLPGTLTVHSAGAGAVTLNVPKAITPEAYGSTSIVASPEATFTFVGLADARPCSIEGFDGEGVCMHYRGFAPGSGYYGDSPTTFGPGRIRIYIVSDAPVTFTATFPGLEGSLVVSADEPFNGGFERIPVRCEPAFCDNIRYGGIARVLPPKTYAATWVSSTTTPSTPVPYSNPNWGGEIGACLYYNNETDPEAYPGGCSTLGPDVITPPVMPGTISALLSGNRCTFFSGCGWEEWAAHNPDGATYAGFNAKRYVGQPGVWHTNAHFVWISET